MAYEKIGASWTPEMRRKIDSMFQELYKEYRGAGDNAKDALSKAENAVAESLEAKGIAEVTREEMLDIIREQTRNGDLAPEIAQARGGQATLGERFNSVDQQLAQTDNRLQGEINRLSAIKADQSFVDSQFSSIVSGAPTGTYTDLETLRNAYPDGTEGVMLVLEDGHWYYWNDEAGDWLDGGLYQAVSWEAYMFEQDEEWVI